MDAKYLEMIEDRAANASPGPWKANLGFGTIEADGNPVARMRASCANQEWSNDFDFIAHARQDIPTLCAAVRSLTQSLEEERTEKQSWQRAAQAANGRAEEERKAREKAEAGSEEFESALFNEGRKREAAEQALERIVVLASLGKNDFGSEIVKEAKEALHRKPKENHG